MPFKKGQSGNPGGRPQGSKNKDISQFKAELKKGLIERIGYFFELLDSPDLSDKDKINGYLRALEFVMPKQQKIEMDADMNTNLIQVQFTPTGIKPIHNEVEFLDD
jgi:hypothetical protein